MSDRATVALAASRAHPCAPGEASPGSWNPTAGWARTLCVFLNRSRSARAHTGTCTCCAQFWP